MLLLTNDGEFANAMMHPAAHVAKNYRVTLRSDITDEQLIKFREGVMLDGRIKRRLPKFTSSPGKRDARWSKLFCMRDETVKYAACVSKSVWK